MTKKGKRKGKKSHAGRYREGEMARRFKLCTSDSKEFKGHMFVGKLRLESIIRPMRQKRGGLHWHVRLSAPLVSCIHPKPKETDLLTY